MHTKKFNRGKKGAIEESVIMIYRLLLVTIIAFFILGVGAFVYDYYADIRDAEAILLARSVVSCFSPDGKISTQALPAEEKREKFLEEYCKMQGIERFYVNVEIDKKDGSEKIVFEEGRSNLAWTKGIFMNKELTSKIRKYKPGILEPAVFPVLIDGKEGELTIGVVVNPEF